MPLTGEQLAKIAVWRAKAQDGTLSIEEMKEAVAVIRQGRMAAATSSEQAKRTKAKKEIRSADDLLSELDL